MPWAGSPGWRPRCSLLARAAALHRWSVGAGAQVEVVQRNSTRSLAMNPFPRTIASLLAAVAFSCGSAAQAASHREAPLIALEPAADNTDVYAFVSYDAANLARPPSDRRVTFIMNVNPGQDPSDGPNYFNFDDDVLYAISIDNNQS